MKLVIVIVHNDDAHKLIPHLAQEGYSCTKLSTTGGFLRAGNTTLMVGVAEERLTLLLNTIERMCKSRKQTTAAPVANFNEAALPYPVEVTVGGATVFVLPVESFHKI